MSLSFAPQREATFEDGCLSLRKAVLDKMRERATPGPVYDPVARVSSNERSLNNISFGTGPARYNDLPEHNKRRVPNNVHHPGPQTYDPAAIQNAVLYQSNHKNVSGPTFGTGKRDCNKDEAAEGTKISPSPAEYDPEMIRRGIMFSKSGSTNVRFGTARNHSDESKQSFHPGPQTYDPEAIKRGIMFTKRGIPSIGFGNAPSKHERKNKLTENKKPGPQDYDTDNIRRGVNSLSTKRKTPGVRFTTGPRTYNDMEEKERASKPGPSTYGVRSTIGPQVNSMYKSQPSISFGAR